MPVPNNRNTLTWPPIPDLVWFSWSWAESVCRDLVSCWMLLGELLAEGLQTEAGLDIQKVDRDPTRQQPTAWCPHDGQGLPCPLQGQAEGFTRTL